MTVFTLIPAYNEEKKIEEVVRRSKQVSDVVFVVDDGSSDSTSEKAEALGVDVIRHDTNRGKGEALKTGFQYFLSNSSDKDVLVVIDADLQYAPEETASLVGPIVSSEVDFVMGARDWSKVPFRHNLGNFVWRTAFNILFGSKLSDTNCGFIAMSRESVKAIERVYGGYIVENSILSQLIEGGLRIGQVPVSVKYLHKSGVPRGVRVFLGVMLFIISEGINYRLGKRNPIKSVA